MTRPYIDDGSKGINLPPDQWRYDPFPVREWERCQSCGHVGADCDCTCCWPDEPDDDDPGVADAGR
jgi:hypothetical protein